MIKADLIQKIKQLEGISQDERSYLINLVNTKKKYGLVWEDKPEEVEEQLRTQLPVLREVVEKRIMSELGFVGLKDSPDSKKAKPLQSSLFEEAENQVNQENQINHGSDIFAPNHILIEGDNLHALTALTFTHEGKIDVIYIDPPYNTGNKDFKYNDRYVDKEDSYRHSKWLSFMKKRLEIAKRLLKNEGIFLISIDDNEAFQLKLLCDEIFLNNFICCVPRVTKSSGKTTNKIALNHDYLLVYAKNKESAIIEGLDHYDSGFKYFDMHVETRGLYKLNQTLDYDSLQYSSSLDYEIEIEGEKFYPGTDYNKYIDRKNGNYSRADWAWRWSKDLYEFGLLNDFIVVKKSKNGSRLYTKTYLQARIEKDSKGNYSIDYFDRKKPITSLDFTNANYSNDNAKKDLDKVIKQSIFDYPKPLSILNTFLKTNPLKKIKILDFFAGSGTTLHATMQLNAEDGGNRQCILVTNNENNICEEVTYERNRKVIQGFTNSKGKEVPGLTNNNLRYYKSEVVPSLQDELNKRLLTQSSTNLLCIKEDCYHDITESLGFNPSQFKIFTNDRGKYMIVVYYSRKQLEVFEQLNVYIKSLSNLTEPIKLYAFSTEKETLMEDFVEVADKIDAVPLPEAIYNAYKAVFTTLKLNEKAPVSSTAILEGEVLNELFDLNQEEE